MERRLASSGVLVGCILALGLGACAIADAISDRAVDYNLEAETAQEQVLLLNVVRAVKQRPMQFTSLQTLTGQAIASETGGVGFPFGHHPNTAAARVFSLSESVSGGPQFVVPVLDTQEFYQGLLRPISPQIIDLYIQARYPKEQVFDLMLHKITINIGQFDCIAKALKRRIEEDAVKPGVKPAALTEERQALNDLYQAYDEGDIVLENSPRGDALTFALFQSLLEHLIDEHGLTTGKIDKKKAFSSDMTAQELADQIGGVARSSDATLKLEAVPPDEGNATPATKAADKEGADDCPLSPPAKPAAASDKGVPRYRLVKTETSYGFCFEKSPVAPPAPPAPQKSSTETLTAIKQQEATLNAAHAPLTLCKGMAKGETGISGGLQDAHKEVRTLATLIDAYCKTSPKEAAQAVCQHQAECVHSAILEDWTPDENGFQARWGEPGTWTSSLIARRAKAPQAGSACYDYVIRVWNKYVAAAHALHLVDPMGATMPYPPMSLSFYPRSTESAIYYLGEVAKRFLTQAPGHVAQVTVDEKTLDFPQPGFFKFPERGKTYADTRCDKDEGEPDKGCYYFFRLYQGAPDQPAAVSVEYDGAHYSIRDAGGFDYSAPTLELVKHLLALNTSAKDLPATTVLTVIGAP